MASEASFRSHKPRLGVVVTARATLLFEVVGAWPAHLKQNRTKSADCLTPSNAWSRKLKAKLLVLGLEFRQRDLLRWIHCPRNIHGSVWRCEDRSRFGPGRRATSSATVGGGWDNGTVRVAVGGTGKESCMLLIELRHCSDQALRLVAECLLNRVGQPLLRNANSKPDSINKFENEKIRLSCCAASLPFQLNTERDGSGVGKGSAGRDLGPAVGDSSHHPCP